MNDKRSDIFKKIGIVSSLYLAVSYIIGIVIFLFILKYQSIDDISQKFQLIIKKTNMIFLTNMLMYIFFGPFLISLIVVLNQYLHKDETFFVKLGSLIGIIWAGSLIASGMIANSGLLLVSSLYKVNPVQAEASWQIIDSIAMGIGNGNGEILGGIFTLCISISGLISKKLSYFTSYSGCIIGIIGMLSTIPVLIDLTGLFGILQIVWFISLTMLFFRINSFE